jgi:CheY-like chemotaxis protein
MLVVGETLCDKETTDALAGWLDMEVETAENDRIAGILATISLVEDKPYEAILIDVRTPDASGLEAARWLRRHGWLGPIIACGDDGGGGDEARKGALEAGCDGFIPKPLSSEKVKAAYAKERKQEAETPPAVAVQREAPKPKMSASDLASLKPRGRVLVVDDALCMQAIIASFLQGMELEADMAVDGQVACDMAMQSLAEGCPYDVILMDIQLPKMDGKKAAKWLRDNGWKGPILAISSHATPKDHAAFLTAGCTDCIAKPITKDAFCKALSQHVQC